MAKDNTPDYSTTTLDVITAEKTKLLSKLKENRAKHSEIYEAAVAGYWTQVKERLESKKGEFEQALKKQQAFFTDLFSTSESRFAKEFASFGQAVEAKDIKSLGTFSYVGGGSWSTDFNTSWAPTFPVHYLADYDRAIAKLEFTVADKITLSTQEFDSYVCNNWAWKQSFADTNRGFVCCTTGSQFSSLGVGYLTSNAYNFAVSGALAL